MIFFFEISKSFGVPENRGHLTCDDSDQALLILSALQRPSNVNMYSDPVLFSALFCDILVKITKQLQLHITCNGLMTI